MLTVATMQEEAQRQHEQRLDHLAHAASRVQVASSSDSLPASVPESGNVPVNMAGRRPDTAYEGGYLPVNMGCKAAPGGISSHVMSDSGARAFSTDTGLGTLQGLGGGFEWSASLQAEKRFCIAQLYSQGLDSLPAQPLPPEKTGARFKPSPRPHRACKMAAVGRQ